MKYAVCFRGIHYLDSVKTYQSVDYNKSYNNNKHFILDDLKTDYDIFISTYHSPKENDMLHTYKPVSSVINNFNVDEHGFKAQLVNHFNCGKLIIEYEQQHNIKYDMIITTRFDYVFFRKFHTMNFDLTKFNIAMKHSSGNCDDSFWIFPRNMLENFMNAIIQLYQTGGITHAINHQFQSNDIHYMYDIDNTDYDNFTTYQYFYKNNFELTKIIEHLNKFKHMNIDYTNLKIN